MLLAVYKSKHGKYGVGEIQKGRFISSENLKILFENDQLSEVHSYISKNRPGHKADGNLNSPVDDIISIWSGGD